MQEELRLHVPDLKVVEMEEVLDGLYTQKEEIKVSKLMHKLLLQSEQIVVKPNILDLDDYDDVKMEPKAIQSDDDNGMYGESQSLYEDDHLDDIGLEVKDLKEEPARGEEKKKRGRPRKKMELESSEDEWEEYSEKKSPKKRKLTTPRKKRDDGDDEDDEDDEEGGRRSWGTTSSRCCKCCRPVAGHPLPRHSKCDCHIHHSTTLPQFKSLDIPFQDIPSIATSKTPKLLSSSNMS